MEEKISILIRELELLNKGLREDLTRDIKILKELKMEHTKSWVEIDYKKIEKKWMEEIISNINKGLSMCNIMIIISKEQFEIKSIGEIRKVIEKNN